MNTIAIIMSVLTWFGFTQEKPKEPEYFMARVTFYCAAEDSKWGDQVACPHTPKAKEGVTIAACKSVAFGTEYVIPRLKNDEWLGDDDGIFVVQDRGPAVCNKKASKGKLPVIDVYVSSLAKMKRLARRGDNVFKIYVNDDQ